MLLCPSLSLLIFLTLLFIEITAVPNSPAAPKPQGPRQGVRRRNYVRTAGSGNFRRQSSFQGVTGIPNSVAADGSVPFRYDIRDLQQNAVQWNLYLLAMERFKSMDQADQLSYYQIAGIHGRPFVSWGDVQATSGDDYNGYCTHVSNLFCTWHRPYLALFEASPTLQLLYDHVQDIASKFPASQQDVNTAAASTFRIPYWDWAKVPPAGQTVLPPSISSTTAQVTRPNGTIQTIRNPLYSYVFHPLNTTDLPEEPFNVWHVTYRWPTSQASNAVSQNSEAASALNSSSSSFRSRLYNLFTNYDMFNNFSNEAWIPDGGQYPKYDSVESIHDQVHGLIGGSGNGNMAIIPYSAFDPIFFLHHAMVDRVWAMWSALWTDTYVDPETQQYGTYTVTAGDTLDVNSPLTPFFYETNGNFWTSADVRNPKTFGYTYPDLVDWNVSNSVYQANVRTIINTLYGPNTTATSGKRTGRGGRARAVKRDQGQDGEEETDGVVVEAASVSEKRCHKQHDEAIESDAAVDVKGAEAAGQPQAQTYNEYIANIRALKHSPSLGGSYFIHFYLSSPSSSPVSSANLTSTSPTNASAPFTAPDHIGTHAVFSGLSSTAISGAAYITGTIPLTPALRTHVASGALASLDPDVVRPFLRSGFDWTVQLHNGTILPSTYAVEGLEISVVTASVSHALAVDEFPVWGDLVALEL